MNGRKAKKRRNLMWDIIEANEELSDQCAHYIKQAAQREKQRKGTRKVHVLKPPHRNPFRMVKKWVTRNLLK